jgi:hypothetical protein
LSLLTYIQFKTFAMSGRGDNNKHGSSGRGSSNQSNQLFVAGDAKQKKIKSFKKTDRNPIFEATRKNTGPIIKP